VPHFIPELFLVLFINLLEVSLRQFFCSLALLPPESLAVNRSCKQRGTKKKLYGEQSVDPNFLKKT